MAVKQTGRKTYKTMQGKAVDMDLLRKRNELEVAVGNAKVNASCLLYTSPSPRDLSTSRMPSSA